MKSTHHSSLDVLISVRNKYPKNDSLVSNCKIIFNEKLLSSKNSYLQGYLHCLFGK